MVFCVSESLYDTINATNEVVSTKLLLYFAVTRIESCNGFEVCHVVGWRIKVNTKFGKRQ